MIRKRIKPRERKGEKQFKTLSKAWKSDGNNWGKERAKYTKGLKQNWKGNGAMGAQLQKKKKNTQQDQ